MSFVEEKVLPRVLRVPPAAVLNTGRPTPRPHRRAR